MVIDNNLTRAFALVVALSIIKFRTVIKDTKDTAYIFLGLAGGMAAGTSSYFLAIAGSLFILTSAIALHLTNYGSFFKTEFLLIFRTDNEIKEALYSPVVNLYVKSAKLLHVEPSEDNKTTKLTFDILIKKKKDTIELSKHMGDITGVSEIRMVASKNDMDY